MLIQYLCIFFVMLILQLMSQNRNVTTLGGYAFCKLKKNGQTKYEIFETSIISIVLDIRNNNDMFCHSKLLLMFQLPTLCGFTRVNSAENLQRRSFSVEKLACYSGSISISISNFIAIRPDVFFVHTKKEHCTYIHSHKLFLNIKQQDPIQRQGQ